MVEARKERATNTTDAQLRNWHFRLRKKYEALREKEAAIEKIRDLNKRVNESIHQSKRSTAVIQETADYVRALTDHTLGWTAKPQKPSRRSSRRTKPKS